MVKYEGLNLLHERANRESEARHYQEAMELHDKVIEGCQQLLSRTTSSQEGFCTRPPDDSQSLPETTKVRELLALSFNNRGHIKYLQVNFDEAVEDYTEAIQTNPFLTEAFYNRGLVHYRMGRFMEAIEDQENVLNLKPDFQSAQMCLIESRKAVGQEINVSS